MNANVTALVYGPKDTCFHDKQVCKMRTFWLDVAGKPSTMLPFLNGLIPVGWNPDGSDWHCNTKDSRGDTKYFVDTNSFMGIARIPSVDPDYLERLIGRGWEFNPLFLEKYAPHLLNAELVAS